MPDELVLVPIYSSCLGSPSFALLSTEETLCSLFVLLSKAITSRNNCISTGIPASAKL